VLGVARQLQRKDVEQGRVVVVLDVIHHFARLRGVAGGLSGVVDVGESFVLASGCGHAHIAQRAGQPDPRHVRRAQQRIALVFPCVEGVGRVVQTAEQALSRDQRFAAVAASTAAQRIAGAVAEGRDAAVVQRQLRRLHEARAVGDLAEIPAFADQVDVAAGGAIDRAAASAPSPSRGWWPIRSKRNESMR
jgi:hypothetical protein